MIRFKMRAKVNRIVVDVQVSSTSGLKVHTDIGIVNYEVLEKVPTECAVYPYPWAPAVGYSVVVEVYGAVLLVESNPRPAGIPENVAAHHHVLTSIHVHSPQVAHRIHDVLMEETLIRFVCP